MGLLGARRPRWRYLLLDQVDAVIGPLDGVADGGDVSVNATTRLGGSASLTITERGQGIDWLSHRVQIVYDPGVSGVEAWPVATMLFTSPVTTTLDGVTTHEVSLLSKMAVIDEDVPGVWRSYPVGTPIIAAVEALIRGTGESRVSVTDSTATLRTSMTWEPDTSTLTVINDLLDAAGYFALWCDGSGQYRVEPYVLPAGRPVAFAFESGEFSIHEDGWSREQDLSSVPNHFVVVGQGSEDDPALVGVAENTDPASPYSIERRGRRISRTESGVEGDQSVLDALAQRRLVDAMSPVGKRSVTHAIVPLDPADVVSFDGVLVTVQSMSFDLVFDGQCSTEWREV